MSSHTLLPVFYNRFVAFALDQMHTLSFFRVCSGLFLGLISNCFISYSHISRFIMTSFKWFLSAGSRFLGIDHFSIIMRHLSTSRVLAFMGSVLVLMVFQ